MPGVPVDTVLLRLALAAALLLPLAGCGGDDPETASTPASTPATATPAPTTVAPTTGPAITTTPTSPAKGAEKAVRRKTRAQKAKIRDDAQSVRRASPVKQTNDSLAAEMKRAKEALDAEGYETGKPVVAKSPAPSGALTVTGTDTTIIFFRSPREAAEAAMKFQKLVENSPQFLKIARKANRLFLLPTPTEPTAKQLADYRQIRKITNGAV